jgi:sulfur carrier protein
MHILINGEPREVVEGATLSQLLDVLELGERRCAIEVNEILIPRSEHADHTLSADDRVEIVQAIGGG